MRIGIGYKLFLAILASTFLGVACMYAVFLWSLDRGLIDYANQVERKRISRLVSLLEKEYGEKGSLEFLRHDQNAWHQVLAESQPDEEIPPGKAGLPWTRETRGVPDRESFPSVQRGQSMPWRFGQRVFLLDGEGNQLSGARKAPGGLVTQAILSHGKPVGYVGLLPHKRLSDIRQIMFFQRQKVVIGIVAVFILLLTVGVSLPLARRMVRPVRLLASAAQKLTAGNYTVRVPVSSTDELGRLARDFSLLATTLERNEQLRRSWVADISHELRTPLAVLRGEIESLQDGVRQPGKEAFLSLHSEVLRLSRLVDDLYQLAITDLGDLSYRKEPCPVARVLESALNQHAGSFSAKGIKLSTDISAGDGGVVFGDPGRLFQLFSNVLDNACAYTDPGGEARVALHRANGRVRITVEDSEPGVPESELENLFERLYRVEGSRNRAMGGAGLGLALCRNIVDAHGGGISAEKSSLGGLKIVFEMPEDEGAAG